MVEVGQEAGVEVDGNEEKEEDWNEEIEEERGNPTNPKVTSWFNQFYYVLKKNLLLLRRRPIMMTIYVLSSVVSVVFAWLVARENDQMIIEEFDDCGTVPYSTLDEKYGNSWSHHYYFYNDDNYDDNYDDVDDHPTMADVQFSLNEKWRNGSAVTLMALGPMVNAILVLFILHGEISSQLLGMLRALAVRDSVYWLSWYLPFMVLSLTNSLLGAIMAQILPDVHAFKAIYFGGVFGSLLFLQLPLIASSFFVAAVLGTTKRALNWIVLIMLFAIWVPLIVLLVQSNIWLYHDFNFENGIGVASGIFWQYANTLQYGKQDITYEGVPSYPNLQQYEIVDVCFNEVAPGHNRSTLEMDYYNCCSESRSTYYNDCSLGRTKECDLFFLEKYNFTYSDYNRDHNRCTNRYYREMEENKNVTYDTCNLPILSKSQGTWFKTKEERAQVTSDDLFVGCYSKASWPTYIWSVDDKAKNWATLLTMYMFPYFHFSSIWGNFLGYTQLPNRKFDQTVINLSPEELSLKALPPSPPDSFNGFTSNLFTQGSTVKRRKKSIYDNMKEYDRLCLEYYNADDNNSHGGYDDYYSRYGGYDDYYSRHDFYNCPISTCPIYNSSIANAASMCPDIDSSCTYAEEPVPTKSKSVLQLYVHLVVLSLIYLLAAAYWAQVFTNGNGKNQQSYLFFLFPSYWRCGGANNPNKPREDAAEQEEYPLNTDDEEIPRMSSASSRGGVVVDSIRKLYGSFEAIKGVSLKMGCGEVTALLGHNGAGKTTLSHILCCEIPPSEGNAYIFGYSVTQDPYSVRNLVGLCKQEDYLWPDLSAREHLELYGGLRGLERSKLQGIVQQWLESVDLAEVQLQYSAAFSGGMKRRLSLALATIGDRPLIILDEPTTGMDPVSRRFVWRHIDEIKKDRVILLTTHAMEEADLLADEVAIMRKGELAALGTPLQLKAEYGSALQFSILVPKDEIEATRSEMTETFFASSMEWVDFDFGESGNITLNIHKIEQDSDCDGVKVKLLSQFVAWLESNESPVTEYGFSNSTLEEVFLKVTDADDEEHETNDDRSRSCCSCCGRTRTAEEIDNDRMAEEEAINRTDEDEVTAGSNSDSDDALATFFPKLTVRNQIPVLVRDFFTRTWFGRGSILNYVIYGLLWGGIIFIGFDVASNSSPTMAFVLPVTALSLLLVCTIAPIYSDRNEGLLYLMRTQGLLAGSHLVATGLYSFLIQFLYGFFVLTSLYLTPLFRSPYVCVGPDGGYGPDANETACYSYSSSFQRQVISYPNMIDNLNFYDDSSDDDEESVYLSAVREPGGYGMILGAALCFALTFPGAVWSTSYIPGYKFPLVCISFVVVILGLLPMVWFVTFGFAYFNYDTYDRKFNECLNVTDPNNLCNTEFNISDVNGDFINCAAYNSLNEMDFYYFCSPPHTALLPQFGLHQMLGMAYQSKIRLISDPPEYVEEVLIPTLVKNGVKCSGDVCKVPQASKVYNLNLLYMVIGSLLLLLLGFIVASIFGFPIGLVLQIRKWIARKFDHLRFDDQNEKDTHREISSNTGDMIEGELPEVTKERETVNEILSPFLNSETEEAEIDLQALPRDEISPVVGSALRKVYPSRGGRPPKVALNNLDLHVPRGQVLGFLGKNGAGKTTALKILAGAHDASDGIGLVAGYDCATERIQVFERLGNCPQFDVVWSTRTVQSHLEFLAGIKGVPRRKIKNVAHSIAAAVGLGKGDFYHRKAGELSGGMRRRLSIAMSLIGSPAVLILDEPTTGLDPSTRSSIWSLVNSFATNDRSMIITTHMMVEADTLCNRIAIIANGQLKVVGTQQHLKNEFGSGYHLQLNLIKSNRRNQTKAMNFVTENLHPHAVLASKQAKTLHVNLPRDNLDLQRVFAALYSPEASTEGCINQFLLSQSSLEDVFVTLGD